ncbi:hypothetical protein G7K_0754-t1 [Saitoella complicata NRRL Y-17804]|uniref:Glycoside hydrolase family 71 protein n=2 Tax=Saitoella complicata (strain BCRC 22490 / CBS 7301 / JCM 7358 / NBRC 10748 / NRRL Y-17804) TaxID=698492 RepID=A0A0E9N9M2_SAICN|nr:hypothetical protein G7K_0754-t1 [Saitoella complicata NRRL Y-17804]
MNYRRFALLTAFLVGIMGCSLTKATAEAHPLGELEDVAASMQIDRRATKIAGNTGVTVIGYNSTTTSVKTGRAKMVFAHFMVGNAYDFNSTDQWVKEMELAQSAGIDGFALNIGLDEWVPDRVASAYEAASTLSDTFYLFFSFDMSIFTSSDVQTMIDYVTKYHGHTNQFVYHDGDFVSTFSGETTFGSPPGTAWDTAFIQPLASSGITIHFVPSWSSLDPSTAYDTNTAVSGLFSWAAWPTSDNPNVTTEYDTYYSSAASRLNKTYMAPVSPWFCTHFSYKNWIYASEDLMHTRWQQVIDLDPELVEIITWNDWGESSYLAPYRGLGAPTGSEAWVEGFSHDAWLDLTAYYIAEYKTGRKTSVLQEKIWYWYRPHSKSAVATADPYGLPEWADVAKDVVTVVVALAAPATLYVTSGSNTVAQECTESGMHAFQFGPFVEGEQRFLLVRDGQVVLNGTGTVDIEGLSVKEYNFNAATGIIKYNDGSS